MHFYLSPIQIFNKKILTNINTKKNNSQILSNIYMFAEINKREI